MREMLWRRLEALEEIHGLRDGPVRITHFNFVRADGSEVEGTVATGPANFVCHRRIGEELDAFQARASDECRATHWRGPMIFVFMD